MTTLRNFECEICGITSQEPVRWFVILCGDEKLAVHRWNMEAATAPGARHFCGEAHAETYVSRWFESVCTPPKTFSARF